MKVIVSILVVTVVTWAMLATQKVSVNATVLPQTGVRLASEGMASVMTGPEYLHAGISSLTESQRRAFDQWLDHYKKTVVDVLQWGASSQSGPRERWQRESVVPVVLVKPRLLGIYEPMKPAPGSHQRWMKSEVKPVVIVRPGIPDYVPDGELTMERFHRKDVIPVALVESTSVGCQAMSFAAKSTRIEPSIGEQSKPTHSVIESKVDGEFEGCDGDSIVKVMNKQIWMQMDYQIQYRYSYMPDVLIYYSAGG